MNWVHTSFCAWIFWCLKNRPTWYYSRNQALRAWIRDVSSRNLRVWSILDGSDPKKSKNKMAIFNLFKNVTTFYNNIFWYVQPLRSFFCRKTLKHSDRNTERQRRSNSSLDNPFLGGISNQKRMSKGIPLLMQWKLHKLDIFWLFFENAHNWKPQQWNLLEQGPDVVCLQGV